MAVEVALAMLQREGRWLMQLRDEIPTIVAPGCWGLFGGHLEPGETPEQALRRELMEEQGKVTKYLIELQNHPISAMELLTGAATSCGGGKTQAQFEHSSISADQ